jgi:ABC-type branched-subunit amino acid transport system permease subunit
MVLAALALFALPFVAGLGGNSWIRILDFALLYSMLALGLNIVVGFAGLLDLGYIAFYAVGAYLAGLLASPQFAIVIQSFVDEYPSIGNFLVNLFGPEITKNGIHLSVWFIVPIGAAVAATFGVVLGAPTLKLRGDYLAIVTLGFGEMIRILLNNLNAPVNLTNGPQGVNLIDPVSLGSLHFNKSYALFGMTIPPVQLYYYLFLVLVILIVFVTIRLQDSRIGRHPRGRDRRQGDGHQYAQHQAARFCDGGELRRGIGDDVRCLPGIREPRVLRPAGVDPDSLHGRVGRNGSYPRRDPGCDSALRVTRGAASRSSGDSTSGP